VWMRRIRVLICGRWSRSIHHGGIHSHLKPECQSRLLIFACSGDDLLAGELGTSYCSDWPRRRTIPVSPPKVDHLGCLAVCWETEL
jgi:hypothetical protein